MGHGVHCRALRLTSNATATVLSCTKVFLRSRSHCSSLCQKEFRSPLLQRRSAFHDIGSGGLSLLHRCKALGAKSLFPFQGHTSASSPLLGILTVLLFFLKIHASKKSGQF